MRTFTGRALLGILSFTVSIAASAGKITFTSVVEPTQNPLAVYPGGATFTVNLSCTQLGTPILIGGAQTKSGPIGASVEFDLADDPTLFVDCSYETVSPVPPPGFSSTAHQREATPHTVRFFPGNSPSAPIVSLSHSLVELVPLTLFLEIQSTTPVDDVSLTLDVRCWDSQSAQEFSRPTRVKLATGATSIWLISGAYCSTSLDLLDTISALKQKSLAITAMTEGASSAISLDRPREISNTIRIEPSITASISTASAIPAPGALLTGEVRCNLSARRVWTVPFGPATLGSNIAVNGIPPSTDCIAVGSLNPATVSAELQANRDWSFFAFGYFRSPSASTPLNVVGLFFDVRTRNVIRILNVLSGSGQPSTATATISCGIFVGSGPLTIPTQGLTRTEFAVPPGSRCVLNTSAYAHTASGYVWKRKVVPFVSNPEAEYDVVVDHEAVPALGSLGVVLKEIGSSLLAEIGTVRAHARCDRSAFHLPEVVISGPPKRNPQGEIDFLFDSLPSEGLCRIQFDLGLSSVPAGTVGTISFSTPNSVSLSPINRVWVRAIVATYVPTVSKVNMKIVGLPTPGTWWEAVGVFRCSVGGDIFVELPYVRFDPVNPYFFTGDTPLGARCDFELNSLVPALNGGLVFEARKTESVLVTGEQPFTQLNFQLTVANSAVINGPINSASEPVGVPSHNATTHWLLVLLLGIIAAPFHPSFAVHPLATRAKLLRRI